MKVTNNWDEENGIALTKISCNDGVIITGTAKVHPEDKDMENAYTGFNISGVRASISYFTKQIQDLKSRIKGLNHYKSILDQNPSVPKDGYEYKMLLKEMKFLDEEVHEYTQIREQMRDELRNYIKDKDRFYKRVRYVRNKGNNN